MFRHLHREPGFYKRLFLLALPLILQNLITTSLGFVDTFMVGMLGQNELSAVTAANTPIYLLQIIILGLLSGLSVLASQYWGKGDTDSINRCMGVSLYAGLIIAVSVAAVLFFFPLHVMALVTNNDLLIELGAPYLRIVGLSYIFNTISSVYIGMQRSTENPAMGMIVFGISMLTNTGLNYILIFGKFGAPALGITGAAIATLTSRVLEFVIVAVYAPRYRRVPLMLRLAPAGPWRGAS
ncbi:MAG: MATE family efflux transporter [Dysosmobacter welbionis]